MLALPSVSPAGFWIAVSSMNQYSGYRLSFGPRISPTVKYLVIINVLVFIWQFLSRIGGGGYGFITTLGLVPSAVLGKLYFWQLGTYLFLHADFWHLFFNMFALWMFGTELERQWGRRSFSRYFFITGIGAGVLSVLADPGSGIPTIGASGAIYGILLAYGLIFPERHVYLYFLFPVKVKYFVGVLGVITFMMALSDQGSAVSHIAHLGGMLVGLVYLKRWYSLRELRKRYAGWSRSRRRKDFEVHENEKPPRKKEDDYWIN